MRATNVALLTVAGMLLTSVSVYSLTPAGGPRTAREQAEPVSTESVDEAPTVPGVTELAHFVSGSTLVTEGWVANPRILRGSASETFVMLEVRASASSGARAAAPVNLAIVIDRSGSMKGSRIRNAVNAATAAVDRLHDGDVVSVVTFDTRTSVAVPPTSIGPGARERVIADIRAISLGGDTCLSCGVEEALGQLDRTPGRVNRMIVLSDGDANHGVRDVPGFRSIGERAQRRGTSVTTIGVDVDYNERILAALAQESNGRHYFVANDEGLARIFEAEAESLTSSIASGAEAALDLAPGVELDRVIGRTFRRVGSRVIVPLGAFDRSEVKTVLLKVRVPSRGEGVSRGEGLAAGQGASSVPVASVTLEYQDLVLEKPGRCEGKLAVEITADPALAGEVDPVVAGRINRSETASALEQANRLFEQGKIDEARQKLEERARGLRAAAARPKPALSVGRKGDVDKDFERQIQALDDATTGFAMPPPPPAAPGAAPARPEESREAKGAAKQNQAVAVDLQR